MQVKENIETGTEEEGEEQVEVVTEQSRLGFYLLFFRKLHIVGERAMDLQHVRRLTVSGSVKICGSTKSKLRGKIFNKTCLKSFSLKIHLKC